MVEYNVDLYISRRMRSVPVKVTKRTCKKVADSVSNSISSRKLAIRYRHLFLNISAQDITIRPPVRHNHKCREYILRSPTARSETEQECEWTNRISVGVCGLPHRKLIRVHGGFKYLFGKCDQSPFPGHFPKKTFHYVPLREYGRG